MTCTPEGATLPRGLDKFPPPTIYHFPIGRRLDQWDVLAEILQRLWIVAEDFADHGILLAGPLDLGGRFPVHDLPMAAT